MKTILVIYTNSKITNNKGKYELTVEFTLTKLEDKFDRIYQITKAAFNLGKSI